MGVLDSLVSGVVKGVLGQAESNGLPSILSQILAGTDLGSVGGLLAKLQQSGLGPEVASWLGNGTNLPVSQDQLRGALNNEQLREMARAAGLPVDDLLAALSQLLPGTVDRMSPNGRLEESPPSAGPAATGQGGSLRNQAGLDDI